MASSTDESIRTRATLVLRLKDWQDESSWQDFFDTYWQLIYNFAAKAGLTDAESQDVVQETMISVARHMPGFKYDPALGSFKSWLFTLVQWRISDQLRKRLPLAPVAEPAAESHTGVATHVMDRVPDLQNLHPDAAWDAKWEENLIHAAVANVKRRVDPHKYQVFDCYVNKGWTAERVAGAFGIPVDQVYMAKHRIADAVKSEVERLRRQVT